jgi:outer membrane lipoprotein carrier protein
MFYLTLGAAIAQTPIDFTTLKQSFVQRVTNEQNQTLVFTGEIWLKQPNFARYDYEKPQKKIVAARGDRILILEPDLEQATRFKSEIALNIIDLWRRSYVVGDGRREAIVRNQKISIEHTDAAITKVYYADDLDNFVEIILSDPKRDEPIDDDVFAPAIPNGWDVIAQ